MEYRSRDNSTSNGTAVFAESARQNAKQTLTKWQMFRAVYRAISILLQNVYCIPSYLVWMLCLRPLLWFSPELYWEIEGLLFSWLLSIVGYWLWSAGYTVAESGADVRRYAQEEALVLVNHQSTGDVPTIMYTFSHHPGVLNTMMWIMEAIFKFTNFGWVSMVHGDFFILQGKATRSQELVRLRRHMETVYSDRPHKWIVLFPEGGFLRKRREASQRYAQKNGYPVLQHVTLPRTGAMKAVVDALSALPAAANGRAINGSLSGSGKQSASVATEQKQIKWVIDMTIGYPQATPLDAFCIVGAHRPPCETKIHYRVFPVEEIPREEEAMLGWLYDRWQEKEQLLDQLYATGRFPNDVIGRASCSSSGNADEQCVEKCAVSDSQRQDQRTAPSIGERDETETETAQVNSCSNPGAFTPVTEPANQIPAFTPVSEAANQSLDRRNRKLRGERKLLTDDVYILSLHVFFLVSFYVQYYVISSGLCLVW